MFETSVVRDAARTAPRRAGLLSVALVAHGLAVAGAVAGGIASIDFPKQAPNQFELFQIVQPMSVPPPLGNPNGGAKPQPKPEPQKPAPTPPVNQNTAPAIVPDDVAPADTPSTNPGTATGNDGSGPGTEPGPLGVPWGDPNSVATDLDLPPVVTNTQPAEEKIHVVGGEVTAPVTIRRVEPRFPPALARIRMKAVITVRCVIDKQGNVRDPQVLRSSLPPFNDSVVAAVQQWKFRPAMLRGQPVDAWFELTVNFDVR